MRTRTRVAAWILTLSCLASPVSAQTKDAIIPDIESFLGTWTANLSKSQRDANHQFDGATLTFQTSGDDILLTHSGVNAKGDGWQMALRQAETHLRGWARSVASV